MSDLAVPELGENGAARVGEVDVTALEDINLEIPTGSLSVIKGPSGSGKSTLLRCANLLEDSQQGEVLFEGSALPPALKGRTRDQLRQAQMIYQMADVAMNPRQTVGTIIGRPLEFYFGLRGDMDQAITPGQDGNKGAKVHQPRHFALVDTAHLHVGGNQLDALLRLISGSLVNTGNLDHTVIGNIDGRTGFLGNLANGCTTLTDDITDLVRIDLDRDDARGML